MEDQATVPLFYEKRVPEVLIQNDDLSEEVYALLEDENLEPAQQEKLEKHFTKEMQVIVRDERLDTIAKDIVYHFPRRGYLGKGMVVALDKFTAVKMYSKVQQHWKDEIKRLRKLSSESNNDIEKARFKRMIDYMKSVEMAAVISDPKADAEKFQQAGLDIQTHIKRLNQLDAQGHDLEYNFKDPQHPLQLVFVCAMWLTGFDAPTVSTLYLDKPMKGHTLMQTIARANRVASYQIKGLDGQLIEKKNGEIIDYYNVFRNMKQALKDYAQGEDGLDDAPVKEKSVLFALLDDAIAETLTFCQAHDIDLQAVVDLSDNEQTAEARYLLAEILYLQKSTAAAETSTRNAISQNSDYPYWVAKSMILLSDIFVDKNDLFNARAALEAVLENFKEDPALTKVAQTKLDAVKSKQASGSKLKQDSLKINSFFDNN